MAGATLGGGELHRHHARLPVAILFFAWEQRKERDNEEEEQYQMLSDAYNEFLRWCWRIRDLQLRSNEPLPDPSPSSGSACW